MTGWDKSLWFTNRENLEEQNNVLTEKSKGKAAAAAAVCDGRRQKLAPESLQWCNHNIWNELETQITALTLSCSYFQ